jgi:hypothetical protein
MQYLWRFAGDNAPQLHESAQSKERSMQLMIAIELALILAVALKLSIGGIEQELKRKPIRYDDPD